MLSKDLKHISAKTVSLHLATLLLDMGTNTRVYEFLTVTVITGNGKSNCTFIVLIVSFLQDDFSLFSAFRSFPLITISATISNTLYLNFS